MGDHETAEAMVDYWHTQEQHSKHAYEYATEQRRYWVNKLITSRQVEVTEVSDGTATA